MANYYSNPTESRALGNVQLEFVSRRCLAKELHRKCRCGLLTPQELELARRTFVGIFRNLPSKRLARAMRQSP